MLRIAACCPHVLIVIFNPHLPDLLVNSQPSFVKNRIKIGFVTWEQTTFMAKIHFLIFKAFANTTFFEKSAIFLAAAPTIFRGKIIQHLLERGVAAKNWIAQESLEFHCVRLKIT